MHTFPASVHSFRRRTMTPTPLSVIREQWTSTDDAPTFEETLHFAENWEEIMRQDAIEYSVVPHVNHVVAIPTMEEMIQLENDEHLFNEEMSMAAPLSSVVQTPRAPRPRGRTHASRPRGRTHASRPRGITHAHGPRGRTNEPFVEVVAPPPRGAPMTRRITHEVDVPTIEEMLLMENNENLFDDQPFVEVVAPPPRVAPMTRRIKHEVDVPTVEDIVAPPPGVVQTPYALMSSVVQTPRAPRPRGRTHAPGPSGRTHAHKPRGRTHEPFVEVVTPPPRVTPMPRRRTHELDVPTVEVTTPVPFGTMTHTSRPKATTFFENVEIRGNSWIEIDESVSETVDFLGQNGVAATVLNDKGKQVQMKNKEKVIDSHQRKEKNSNEISNKDCVIVEVISSDDDSL